MSPRSPRRSARWTISARVTVLSAATAALIVAVAVAIGLTASMNNDRVDRLVNVVGPIRTDGEQLLVALLNQETGIRGYAISGDPNSLQPYTDGLVQERDLLTDLRPRLSGYPQVATDLVTFETRAAGWRATVAQPVIARVRAGDERGAQAVLNQSSTTQFDRIRDAAAAVQNDVQDLRDTAVGGVQESSREIVDQLAVAAAIVAAAGIALALLLRRMVAHPVTRLAASVRTVAGGDFNHVIDVPGPPELAELGQDVENMRRRIVDDLRVVRRARDQVAEANLRLERHAADLVRSNQDLEQFAYIASHDLQEPLRKVASFCQLLQRRYAGQLDERADQYIAFAVDGAHRMQRLINDLLSFSRIGRGPDEFAPVDLNRVVAAAASGDSRVGLPKNAVSWSDLPVVPGSEQLLTALFSNLISNSVKFRRPDVPAKVWISATRVGSLWEITCRDNGIGIDPGAAEKIFVIFQRLHHRDAYPGTGIGLAIAQRIVEHHGGRIWADTASADGATIRFTLPATRVPAEQAAAPAEQAAAPEQGPASPDEQAVATTG